jgi:hypothetical protein
MNLLNHEKPGRRLADYIEFKLNSVGYPIGLLPDDPTQENLVSSGTNWEHIPPSLILNALKWVPELQSSLKTMNEELSEARRFAR